MKTMLAIAAALVAAVLALGLMPTQITAYAQDIGAIWETEVEAENELIEEAENELIEETQNERIQTQNEQLEEAENELIETQNERIQTQNEQLEEAENELIEEAGMEAEDSQITIRLPNTTNFEFPLTGQERD